MTTLKEILAGKCGEENQIWVTHVTEAVTEWLQQKRQEFWVYTQDCKVDSTFSKLLEELKQ